MNGFNHFNCKKSVLNNTNLTNILENYKRGFLKIPKHKKHHYAKALWCKFSSYFPHYPHVTLNWTNLMLICLILWLIAKGYDNWSGWLQKRIMFPIWYHTEMSHKCCIVMGDNMLCSKIVIGTFFEVSNATEA